MASVKGSCLRKRTVSYRFCDARNSIVKFHDKSELVRFQYAAWGGAQAARKVLQFEPGSCELRVGGVVEQRLLCKDCYHDFMLRRDQVGGASACHHTGERVLRRFKRRVHNDIPLNELFTPGHLESEPC